MSGRGLQSALRQFVRDIWDYREVLYFMLWRDFIVRYKQTFAGLWWAVLSPLLGLGVYWWAFGVVAKLPSDSTPYPLFIFTGLIPFTFVSDYIGRATDSLTNNSDLIQKIFFPRIFVPLSALLIGCFDFTIMLGILVFMMLFYGYLPGLACLWLPLWLGIAVMFAFGLGLLLAAVNTAYRDVSRASALVVRLLMFVSPVFYSRTLVPSSQTWTYDLNPLSGIIQGFRWSLLSTEPLMASTWISAGAVSLLVFLLGLAAFQAVDANLADNL